MGNLHHILVWSTNLVKMLLHPKAVCLFLFHSFRFINHPLFIFGFCQVPGIFVRIIGFVNYIGLGVEYWVCETTNPKVCNSSEIIVAAVQRMPNLLFKVLWPDPTSISKDNWLLHWLLQNDFLNFFDYIVTCRRPAGNIVLFNKLTITSNLIEFGQSYPKTFRFCFKLNVKVFCCYVLCCVLLMREIVCWC